jgi:hypothetical protein
MGVSAPPSIAGESPRIFTVAGNGGYVIDAAPGPRDGARATSVQVEAPRDVALAADGSIIYAEGISGAVRRIGLDGRLQTLVSEDQTDAQGLAVLPDGSVLIATGVWGTVVRRAPDGSLTTIAGSGDIDTSSGDGGPATAASMRRPAAVAPMPDGSLLVLEPTANRVRRIRPDGIIEAAAGTGQKGRTGDGGPAIRARLYVGDDDGDGDIAALPDGGFLIAETYNHRVRRVHPSGVITTVAGDGRRLSRGDGGPATAASITDPVAVAVTRDGGFLVSELFGRRVRRVGPDGVITTVAGVGVEAPSSVGAPVGDGGAARAALASPFGRGLALLPGGGYLFTDFSRIRLVAPRAPALAAVAVIGARQTSDGRASIRYRTTATGKARITLRSTDGHIVGQGSARATTGSARVRTTRPVRPGVYWLTLSLNGLGGRGASTVIGVVIGDVLPERAARTAIANELADASAAFSEVTDIGDCRRMSKRRIDCVGRGENVCVHMAAVTLRAGFAYVRDYPCGGGFDPRPRWSGPSIPQTVVGTAPLAVGQM